MSLSNAVRGTILAAILSWTYGLGSTAHAETNVSFSKWVEEVRFGGDVRFRQENFENSGSSPDRQRQRIRLRIGAEFKLPNRMAIKTRLGTGEDQDQVSTNQTLTDNASKKPVTIDLAYLKWTPADSLKFNVGKMENPFWTVASSDLMWDTDYTPEGLSEGWQSLVGPVNVFIHAGQFAIEERSSNLEDAYLFTEQAGVEVRLPLESRIVTAMAHHEFANVKQGGIGGTSSFSGQTGVPFSVLEWTTALKFWLGRLPVSLQGTYVKNHAAPETTVSGALSTADEQDRGLHAGLVLGKAKAGAFEVGAFYKEVEKDAVPVGITDSDFPNTTNAQGYIGWIAYGLNDFATAQIKHFDAEKKAVAAGADDGSVARTQFDISFKF